MIVTARRTHDGLDATGRPDGDADDGAANGDERADVAAAASARAGLFP